MGEFNKSDYDKLYNKTKRKMYGWNLSSQEYQAFYDYCLELEIDRSSYLKKLVNEDAIKRGYNPIFSIKDTE